MRSNFPLCSSFCGYLTIGLTALVGVMPISAAYASCSGGQIPVPDQQYYARQQAYCWSPTNGTMSVAGHALTPSQFAGYYCNLQIRDLLNALQSDGSYNTPGFYYGPGGGGTTYGYKIEGNSFRCTASFNIAAYKNGKMIKGTSTKMTILYRPFYKAQIAHHTGSSGAGGTILLLTGTLAGEGSLLLPSKLPGNLHFGKTSVTYGFCLTPLRSANWNQTPPRHCYWLGQ